QLLVDEQATADALRRGLHSFLRRAAADDRVVVFFAGHGRQPGGLGGVPYFLTYDTDPREMAVTAVPMDEFRRAVSQSITAKQIVAFVDACHGGGVTLATRGLDDNQLINRYLQELSRSQATVATFAASQENQESFEGAEYGGGHGAFTWFLLQGLGGEADRASEQGDENGAVSLRELAAYVTRKVKEATGNQQEPSLSFLRTFPDVVLSVLRVR
ncbi:MAG: caspase family protein, partial [Gemmataceae bacterium]|nr:caspase family protein [Gemmataceae bacterium]